MTTRLLFAIPPALVLFGCAAPKATVVEEPKPTRTVASRRDRAPDRAAAEPTLRDPDVVSELPGSPPVAGATPPAPAPAAAPPADTGTVIARPPAPGGSQ